MKLQQDHPIGLYIHIPWCIKKCPYCDFNSHKKPNNLSEQPYIDALINDLREDLKLFDTPPVVSSIFLGGGTPSLFQPKSYESLFNELMQLIKCTDDVEITLEANPSTFEAQRFKAFRNLGINRLSIGVQSFNDAHLKSLGRIHDAKTACKAIETAFASGFNNLNIDIMYGLPKQTLEQALEDLHTALSFKPKHLSWYQLTLEQNTLFYKYPPKLPDEELICAIESQGKNAIKNHGFEAYEISAYSQKNYACRHNLNYWQFGDYLGIGAGAHAKLSCGSSIKRLQKKRQPKDYLNPEKPFLASTKTIHEEQLAFEYMLNRSRLYRPISKRDFVSKTNLNLEKIKDKMQKAIDLELIIETEGEWIIQSKGYQYLNNLQEIFL